MTSMPILEWHGAAAPAALAAALRGAGFETARPGATNAIAAVHCTSSGKRLPSPGPNTGNWIWLCQATLDDGHRTEAIARGAYDAISLRDPHAADELIARLAELAVPQPV